MSFSHVTFHLFVFIIRLRFQMAIYEVNVCELILYIITLLAVVAAMVQMRNLKYFRKNGGIIVILFFYVFLYKFEIIRFYHFQEIPLH